MSKSSQCLIEREAKLPPATERLAIAGDRVDSAGPPARRGRPAVS